MRPEVVVMQGQALLARAKELSSQEELVHYEEC